jgi:ubiquinone/menaquinone biosynthesis C-methylase UbiE
MTDILAYNKAENYMRFQERRPDYVHAIDTSLELARKYTKGKTQMVMADFCCGTGSNTLEFAASVGGIAKVILIDINERFLDIAKSSGIQSKSIETKNENILTAILKKECDLVLSIFAYHHVEDKEKQKYVEQIKTALMTGGILVLTEIYLKDQDACIAYYKNLYNAIPSNKRIPGLKEFLLQTARSQDFEFKVTKEFADNQFTKSGFKKLEEK